PLSDQEVGQLGQAPDGKRQAMISWMGLGDLFDLPPLPQRELRRPPLYLGYSESNPSALKLRITSRTRSSLVNATFAIAAASMPWAGSSTICARRQVRTDLLPRRTIRTCRAPSSPSISRTCRRSTTGQVCANSGHSERPAGLPWPRAGAALPSQREIQRHFGRRWRRPGPAALAGLAALAEAAGWDAFLLEDYLSYRGLATYDPWVCLAAIASATT